MKFEADLTDEQAGALSQVFKRIGFSDVRKLSADDAQLKRSNFGRPSPVLDAEIIHPLDEGTFVSTADGYKKAPMSAQEPRSEAMAGPDVSQGPRKKLTVSEAVETIRPILRQFGKVGQARILEQLRHLSNEGRL